MENKLWSLAAIALILASCANNEILEEPSGGNVIHSSSLINLLTSTGKVTRATDNDVATLQSGFNVIALNVDDKDIFAVTTGTADNKYIWDGTLNGGSWKWQTETDEKRWPEKGYPITFYTHFPIDANITKDKMSAEITIEDALADQIDMLAAKTEVKDRPLNGMASLNFKHILSNIKFSILSKQGFKIYIQSIRVLNVAKDGRTYNYKAMDWDGLVVPTTHKTVYTYRNTVSEITGDNVTAKPVASSNNSMILLPQNTAAAWDPKSLDQLFSEWAANNTSGTLDQWRAYFEGQAGARIEVIYRMEDSQGKSVVGWKTGDKYSSDKSGEITVKQDLFVRVGYPLDLTAGGISWESGKRYNYVISLGTDDATNGTILDPSFSDNKGGGTDIPNNNPAVNPGGNVTYGGYIMFDVSVSRWDDTPGDISVI